MSSSVSKAGQLAVGRGQGGCGAACRPSPPSAGVPTCWSVKSERQRGQLEVCCVWSGRRARAKQRGRRANSAGWSAVPCVRSSQLVDHLDQKLRRPLRYDPVLSQSALPLSASAHGRRSIGAGGQSRWAVPTSRATSADGGCSPTITPSSSSRCNSQPVALPSPVPPRRDPTCACYFRP